MPTPQSPGRERNAALPLGRRSGDDTDAKAKATGRAERKSAGPDGAKASVVGDTFKR